MYVKLKEERKLKGKERVVGYVTNVADSLGEKMVLCGVASKSNEAEYENYKLLDKDPKTLKKEELIIYAELKKIEVNADDKKDEILKVILEAEKE